MKRLAVAIVVGAMTVACGAGSSNNPVGPSSAAPASSGVPFSMVLQTSGLGVSFTVTLNGQTYTANGIFSLQLRPGVYTLSGSFTPTGVNLGEGLLIGFQRSLTTPGSGGVLSGSVRSLSGPVLTSGLCSLGFVLLDASKTPQSFRMQFEVTTNGNSSCQLGA